VYTLVPYAWNRWNITPNTKVRSMKSDIWKKRPCWEKYCAFKDAVKSAQPQMFIETGCHIVFHLAMPDSWSQRKKVQMAGQPHEQAPDLDNLLGGLFDAVFTSAERGGKGDQHVHTIGSVKKVWAWEGAIEIGRPM